MNFGFEIHSGRQIDLDKSDSLISDELDQLVGAWRACINCGSCAATCPGGLNFRKVHYLLRLPDQKPDRVSLKSCMLCGKCQLVCPRGIPTRFLSLQIMELTKRYAEDIPSI